MRFHPDLVLQGRFEVGVSLVKPICVEVGVAGDVTAQRDSPYSERLRRQDGLVHSLAVNVGDDDVGASAGKFQDAGASDATGPPVTTATVPVPILTCLRSV